ncbi:hypothetical protein HDU86_008115 [Geranomyces michiganensis]|nr:hypothetical protein HDU86_008115 [Geranomyces michiganensis]
MTLQISDYLDNYLQLCREKDVFSVPSLCRTLQNAIDVGTAPDAFYLSGAQSDLTHTRLTDTYVDILITPLVSCGVVLRELDMSCNEIGDAGATALAKFLKDDSCLETLNLRANSIQSAGIAALSRALHLNERLRTLDISSNNIGTEGGMELANMLQLNSTLQTLSIASGAISATGLIALSTVLRNNATLVALDLSNNFSFPYSRSATADIMKHFAAMLECNFTLRDIGCRKMRILDEDVRECWGKAVESNIRITELDLSANTITRDGSVILFRALHNHPSLTTLKLSSCKIQDEGAEAVALMLAKNFSLTTLYIDYNSITGVGLIAIAKAAQYNQTLKRIRMWGNIWNTAACEVWAPLLGGPQVDVHTSDSLRERLARPGAMFPMDGRHTVSVHAKTGDAAKDQFSGQYLARFNDNDVDIVFYGVEGVICVARRGVKAK